MNSIGVVTQPDVRVVVVVDLSSALPRQLAAPVVVPGASSCAPLDRLISRRAAEAELFFVKVCRTLSRLYRCRFWRVNVIFIYSSVLVSFLPPSLDFCFPGIAHPPLAHESFRCVPSCGLRGTRSRYVSALQCPRRWLFFLSTTLKKNNTNDTNAELGKSL